MRTDSVRIEMQVYQDFNPILAACMILNANSILSWNQLDDSHFEKQLN